MTRRNVSLLILAFLCLPMVSCGFLSPRSLLPLPRAFDGYQVGDLGGPLADELVQELQMKPHDGVKTDAPIIIGADVVASLNPLQRLAIKAAFEKGYPIVLVQAIAQQIDALHELLGDGSPAFEFPEGIDHAEIYAIDKEADGSLWNWVGYPPAKTATTAGALATYQVSEETGETALLRSEQIEETSQELTDSDDEQDDRAEAFAQWLDEDGVRSTTAEATKAYASASETADDNSLVKLARQYSQKFFFSFDVEGDKPARVQVQYFMYSCHSVETGHDWFLMQQYGDFATSPVYIHGENKLKGWFLNKVSFNAEMLGFENKPQEVTLIDSSPPTANNMSDVTSSVSWNVGGELGMEGPKVTGGITVGDSTTFHIADCSVENHCFSNGNNARWEFIFGNKPKMSTWGNKLSDPPPLARSTFSPRNQWIWEMSSKVRPARMLVKGSVTYEKDSLSYHFLWSNLYWYTMEFPFPHKVILHYPPLQ